MLIQRSESPPARDRGLKPAKATTMWSVGIASTVTASRDHQTVLAPLGGRAAAPPSGARRAGETHASSAPRAGGPSSLRSSPVVAGDELGARADVARQRVAADLRGSRGAVGAAELDCACAPRVGHL